MIAVAWYWWIIWPGCFLIGAVLGAAIVTLVYALGDEA